ncbi:unnamed protein product [Clonostachys rhizophaga]|uniref:Uncharacterized protein n=1 Tax=Clonostachys rhizophaga TaxID=160324 RepID=A0A9N9VG11_9HYPO|nr:unnamed protein product [Clonostachys rhizophaga]
MSKTLLYDEALPHQYQIWAIKSRVFQAPKGKAAPPGDTLDRGSLQTKPSYEGEEAGHSSCGEESVEY